MAEYREGGPVGETGEEVGGKVCPPPPTQFHTHLESQNVSATRVLADVIS